MSVVSAAFKFCCLPWKQSNSPSASYPLYCFYPKSCSQAFFISSSSSLAVYKNWRKLSQACLRNVQCTIQLLYAYMYIRMLQPDFKPLTGLYTIQLDYKLISKIQNWPSVHKDKKLVNKLGYVVKKWAHTCTGWLSISCVCGQLSFTCANKATGKRLWHTIWEWGYSQFFFMLASKPFDDLWQAFKLFSLVSKWDHFALYNWKWVNKFKNGMIGL